MLNTGYPWEKKGFILQPKVAHVEKFTAAHSAANIQLISVPFENSV